MAAFKTLNSQDVIISPLEVNKNFYFEGGTELASSNVGIDRFLGYNTTDLDTTGYTQTLYQSSVYNSVKQLYYSNYLSGSNGQISNASTASFNLDGTITGVVYSPLFYNFEQTNLNPKKYFPTGSYTTTILTDASLYGEAKYGEGVYGVTSNMDPRIGVMSIPKNLFGDYIQPNSLRITTESGSYKDDGEGRILRYNNSTEVYVGNIIYQHGVIIITGGDRQTSLGENSVYGDAEYGNGVYGGRTFGNNDILNFVTSSNVTCSFSSSYSLYETQYKCTIGESEFNFSQNPSLAIDNEGNLRDFVNQDYFSPYITTVGLYNDQYELIAVGKLGQPLPTSKTTDTTILINIDRQ